MGNLFSFNGEVGRLKFLGIGFLYLIGYFVIVAFLAELGVVVGFFIYTYLSFALSSKRLNHMKVRRTTLWMLVIPFVNVLAIIFLIFRPGAKEEAIEGQMLHNIETEVETSPLKVEVSNNDSTTIVDEVLKPVEVQVEDELIVQEPVIKEEISDKYIEERIETSVETNTNDKAQTADTKSVSESESSNNELADKMDKLKKLKMKQQNK